MSSLAVTGSVWLPTGEKLTASGSTTISAPMAFGVDTDATATAVSAHVKLYPKTAGARFFVAKGAGYPNVNSPLAKLLPASATAHWSFRDTDPTGMRTSLSAITKPTRVTLWHEGDRQNAGGLGPAGYQAAWKTLRSVRDSLPNAHLIELASVHTGYWSRQPGNDWRVWWPAGYADSMYWDEYNDNWTGKYLDPQTLLGVAISAAAEAGVPWGIAELGSIRVPSDTDGSGRVQWMRDVVTLARANGCRSANWWCAAPSASNPTWIYHLDGTNSAPELACWQGYVASQ